MFPKFKHVEVVSKGHSFAKIEFRWNSHANIQISFANIKICLSDPFQYLSLQFTYFYAFWQQKAKIIYGECFKGNKNFTLEKDKILKTYFQNYVNAESELRLFVSRFCLCCFSFQAFWGNVPQGGNPEFKVSYLFPPSNSSNTVKQDFV